MDTGSETPPQGPRRAPRSTGAAEARPEDTPWMELALEEARIARAEDEVPIGAVLVDADGRVLGRGHNRTRGLCDPSAHAEVLALREAATRLGVIRLVGTTLYTTVEPCFMCAGALVHARVERVVWSVRDPKFGGAVSLGGVLDHPGANHRLAWSEGPLEEEARALLVGFFREKRRGPRSNGDTAPPA